MITYNVTLPTARPTVKPTLATVAYSTLKGRAPEEFIRDTWDAVVAKSPALQKVVAIAADLADIDVEVIVAGGFFRDNLLKGKVEDIDIFVKASNEEALSRAQDSLQEGSIITNSRSFYGDIIIFQQSKVNMDGLELNFVYKTMRAEDSLLDTFTADLSKLGLNLTTGEVYVEGFKAVLDNNITIKHQTSYEAMSLYIKKLLAKSWAKCSGLTFTYNHFGLFEEVISANQVSVGGSLEALSFSGEDSPVVCVSQNGFWTTLAESDRRSFEETDAKLQAFKRELAEEVSACSGTLRYVDWTDFAHVALLVREGYLDSMDVQSYVAIYQKELVLDLIESNQVMEGLRLERSKKPLGWDILEEMSYEDAADFVHGMKRKALANTEIGKGPVVLEWLRINGGLKHLTTQLTDNDACFYNYRLPTHKFKMSTLGNYKAESIGNLLAVINWAQVVGREATSLSEYHLGHWNPDYANVKPIPPKFHKALVGSSEAITWVFDKALDIDWGFSNSLKKCILAGISKVYEVTPEVAEAIYKNPGQVDALDFARRNPNGHVETNPAFPRQTWETDKYVLEMLPKQDVKNLFIGNLTSCCQHIHGHARTVCKESWVDPNSINYVIKAKSSGDIYAHFWCWVSAGGDLVIDSVEGRFDKGLIQHTCQLVEMFCKDNKNVLLSTTGYGMTKDVARYLGISESLKDSTPRSMTAYSMMDADFVRKTPGFEGDITYVNYAQLEVTYNDLTFDFNFEETDVPF